jgi:hypothetical protein
VSPPPGLGLSQIQDLEKFPIENGRGAMIGLKPAMRLAAGLGPVAKKVPLPQARTSHSQKDELLNRPAAVSKRMSS